MKKIILIILVFIISLSPSYSENISPVQRWEKFAESPDCIILKKWIKDAALKIKEGKSPLKKTGVSLPVFYGRTGLFITIVINGRVRGCYGAFYHRSEDPEQVLTEYIKGALFLDPRHRPVEEWELDEAEIILTVASFPEPVRDINYVDISNSGLLIECEGCAGTVIVPAEYRTVSFIENMISGRQCQISKFKAITIK